MKKEIFIPIIIWIAFLILFIIAKIPINEVLLCQTTITFIILFVMLYRRFKRKYRSIPEKIVTAKYVKEYQSWDSSNENEYRTKYVGVYEYELNGKKYKYKMQKIKSGIWPYSITLRYRKGKRDIHTSVYDDIPILYRIFWGLLIFPGSELITIIILKFIFSIEIV